MSDTTTTVSPQEDLDRLALRAATAIRAYHLSRGMTLDLEARARRCQAELLGALPTAGQIVKTPLGVVERQSQPSGRRSVDKKALEEAYEGLPENVKLFMDPQQVATVTIKSIPADILDVVLGAADVVATVSTYPKISDLEKLIPEREEREKYITTPPARPDIILLDGVGITSGNAAAEGEGE